MNNNPASENVSLLRGESLQNALSSTSVVASIASVCTGSPGNIAVAFDEKQITYRELDIRSARVAAALAQSGVGSGDRVAVFMERSIELVCVLLGVMRCGAAYSPIDVDSPSSRVGVLLEELCPACVICDGKYLASIRASAGENTSLDLLDAAAVIANGDIPAAAPLPAINLQVPAYVLFTSGSTGKPKGVVNSHEALAKRIAWQVDVLEHNADQVFVQKTPYTFDVSVWEFFLPLCIGAKLCVMPHEQHKDPLLLKRFFAANKVSVAHFVPTMLDLFLDAIDTEQFEALECIVCSGEALGVNSVKESKLKLPQTSVFNLYGPTEAAIDVTYWECIDTAATTYIPIGKPAPNCNIYILDENREPVAIGAEGELYIGGPQVASGYLNRPELTEKVFVPDPYAGSRSGSAAKTDSRMYATGDRAAIDERGLIRYLGRKDSQVKLRGQRLELGEIEYCLQAIPDVNHNSVQVVMVNGEQALVACVNTQKALPEPALRSALESTLPAYMVPQYFIDIADWPTTKNGKADKKALLGIASAQLAHAAPSDHETGWQLPEHLRNTKPVSLDAVLADIWKHVLGVDNPGLDDAFFDIGGTSLKAARVVNILQKLLGEDIFVVSIYEHSTIDQYARFLAGTYPEALSTALGIESSGDAASITSTGIDASDLEAFEQVIPRHLSMDRVRSDASEKLAPALFILAPPRSGTSLLRLMLTSNDALYGGNEIQLLHFHNMAERRAAYSGKYSLWSEGLVRLLMDLRKCSVDEALACAAKFEEDEVATREVYRTIQDELGGKILVDKSPSYALDAQALEKSEVDFNEPLYIQLVRDPASVASSFVEHHMDQALYTLDHNFSAAQLAELVWTQSHLNINRFFENVPDNRKYRISYESLVNEPERTIRELCSHFNIGFSQAMLNPYERIDKKMVDGIYPESRSMTDPTLLKQSAINPELAQLRKQNAGQFTLGKITHRLAAELQDNLVANADVLPQAVSRASRGAAVASLRKRRQR